MLLVRTEDDVSEALALINQSEILAYDTETDGLDPRRNRVIGFGVSGVLDGFYCPIWRYDVKLGALVRTGPDGMAVQRLLKALQSKKLITWNASFDFRFTKFNLGVDLLPSLHADVLLMKHTCDESFPFGLKEVATKLYGTDVKKEKEEMQASIKASGGTPTQYYRADTGTLAKYCVQDCLLTFRLYNHYSQDLKRQGLEDFYYTSEVLPLYKTVTIPMEERGVRLDVPALEAALADINSDLSTLEASIQAGIAPYLGAIFTPWFLNKEYPTKTFTGKVPAWQKKHATQADAWRADNPQGYMFNLLSKHHLKKLFFDTLAITPTSTTEKGSPQVNDEFISSLADRYPWCADLSIYNSLTKLKGTYIERLLNERHDDRFYPSYQQHRTVSGRYGSDLQQLPRPLESGHPLVVKHTNRIRSFIIPDHGCVLVAADFQQLEPSVFAHTSGDPALAAIFNNGLDFYSEVAIRTERLTGVSSDKSSPSFLGALNKSKRQKAKAYALGIAYGMTGYKLQFELGVPQEEADGLVQDYLSAFPKLASWMAASQDEVRLSGRIRTQSGRIRRMPEARSLHLRYGLRLSDSLYLWKTFNRDVDAYAQAKLDRKTYVNCLNNAINFQVQGLAASILNRCAIELAKRNYLPCMQVHDELVFNIPSEEQSKAISLIKHVMENTVKLNVPLRVEPQTGTNYLQCK